MKPRTVLLLLGILVSLVFLVKACTVKVKNSIKTTLGGVFTDTDNIFKDTDFVSGEYAIVLDGESPAILIDDAAILEENKNKINTDVNWMTYLPGEGGRGAYGIRLFKNRQLQNAVLARKFNTFEVGDLRTYGKPVERKSVYEPREPYLKQKDSLEKLPNVYIERTTELDSMGYDHRFTLRFPSLLVSAEDTLFNADTYGRALAQRVKNSLGNSKGFRTGNNALEGSMTPPILTIETNGSEHYLEDSKTRNYIRLDGYVLHSASLKFFGTPEFYEDMKQRDFTDAFQRQGLSEDDIKVLIREIIGPDTEEIKLSDIYKSTFKGFEVGKLQENKYELRYFQVQGQGDINLTENRDA